MADQAGDPDLSVLSSVVSRQVLDLNVYAAFLQSTLAGALPADYVSVERKRSLFRREDQPVTAVSVTLGEQRFVLCRPSPTSPPHASIAHQVGGVTLRTENVPLADWAGRLAAALAELARQNADAAAALARITSFNV